MPDHMLPIVDARVLQEFYIDPKTKETVYTHYRFQFRRVDEFSFETIQVIPVQVDPPNET
jgi:hypothetical protein